MKATMAWVTMIYDFDTEEELNKFVAKWKAQPRHYVEYTGEIGDGRWTARVEKPYGKYEMGR